MRAVAEIGQRVTEFMRKLKAILRPISISTRQTDRNSTVRGALEIDLRMISSVVDIDTVELSPVTMSPNFGGGRLQYASDIRRTSLPKPIWLHMNIEGLRDEYEVIVCCSRNTAR